MYSRVLSGLARCRLACRRLGAATLFAAPQLLSASVGGGYLHGGLDGEYFANTSLTAPAAFARRDVRLDFDWGNATPGGSTSPAFASVAADNYSVRWTGQLSSRFSETYTFKAVVDDGVVVRIKPTSSGTYTTLINQSTLGTYTAAYAMQAGAAYDIQVEYREYGGTATCRLLWSSPSTPEEVIDVAGIAAINVASYGDQLWADAMRGGRDEWRDPTFSENRAVWPARDADGWPMGDAKSVVWEGQNRTATAGDYLLQFTGRAAVTTQFEVGNFIVDGTSYGTTLPFGAGYNAATNTTTAIMRVTSSDILFLQFTNTRRNPTDTSATGVSQVRLMRPVAVGSTSHYPVGMNYAQPLKDAFKRYGTIRWIMNFEDEPTWADRLRPDFSSLRNTERTRFWEHQIMFSNETGKDLYLCTPHHADADYQLKVAQMVRYGSDGVNPYTSPQANPVYPPLNPNLRVYVERSNEIWNWAFTQAGQSATDARLAVLNNTPDGQIVNFDGQAPNGDFNRWHALKTVQLSNTFRSVFGDAAMGARVRVLYEYQYDNAQGTAEGGLSFVDNYFNNATGNHVATPRPVNYYFWGAGGAVYYGAGNPRGVQTEIGFANGGFEAPALADGTASQAPSGASFSFVGTAGIFRNPSATPGLTGQSLAATRNDLGRPVGMSFTTGANALGVYELGRWVVAGNSQEHSVRLVRAVDKVNLGSVTIRTNGATAGQYAYAKLNRPVVLAPNTQYYLVSDEFTGGDQTAGASTTVIATADFVVNGAVSATRGTPDWDVGTWTFSVVETGSRGYGPLNLRYTRNPVGAMGFPNYAPAGTQAAYIAGSGEISQAVNFTRAGTYALYFRSASKDGAGNRARFYLDSTEITPTNGSFRVNTQSWYPGGTWGRDGRDYLDYNSAPFEVTSAGTRTIRIVGAGAASDFIFFDELSVASADAIFNSGIPGSGEALGQISGDNYIAQVNSQARYALAYGLKVVAYEGGWSLGGDIASLPLQLWCKYREPRTRQAQRDSFDAFARSGGFMYVVGTYDSWPGSDTTNASTYPLAQGVDDHQAVLPPPFTNGYQAPAVLRPSGASWRVQASGTGINAQGGWLGWNLIIPRTGTYEVRTTTGAGATLALEVDGTLTGDAAASGGTFSRSVTLTAGLHHLKVRSLAGSCTVDLVTIASLGAPSSPTITSIVDANLSLQIHWGAVTGATSYTLRWGTEPGVYTNSIDVGLATNHTLTGLQHNRTYYVAVGARNAAGEGLPSGERGAVALADGQAGILAGWDLLAAGSTIGNATRAAATSASSRVVVSALERGLGFIPDNIYISRTDGYLNTHHGTVSTLSAAKSNGAYIQWTVTPAAGQALSLQTCKVAAYQQAPEGSIDLHYSLDGFATEGTSLGAYMMGSNWTGTVSSFDLGGLASLQGVVGTVTFRAYLYGTGTYSDRGLGGIAGNNHDVELVGSLASTSNGTIPSAPSLLSVQPGNGQLSVSWSAVSGATSYTVRRGTATGNYTSSVTGIASTSTTLTGLTNGTVYYITVAATNAAGTSANAAELPGRPALTVPVGPAGYTFVANEGQGVEFVQAVDLAYGAVSNGTAFFAYQNAVQGSVSFGNARFGDPINGVVKAGFFRLAGTGTPNSIPEITTTSLPTATNGTAYSAQLQATGGDGTITWSISAGSLPSGLSLSSSGLISGTPTASGSSSFTARVADTQNDADTQALTLAVQDRVAPPSFSPAGGTYTGTQSVTLSTGTSGATIRYTTDGSNPTASSGTVYSGPVSVASSLTLKAIATKSGSADSSVASASYTINQPPPVTIVPNTVTGAAGYITRQYWTGIAGTAITDLTANAAYPNSPTGTTSLISLEAVNWANPSQTANFAESYGQRIVGYLVAPTTGSYTFWVSGDDQCELWLSTDMNAANKVRIARVPNWTPYRAWANDPAQKSTAINLVAGQRYYLEVLMKEGGGGDSLSVGWAKPGEATTAPSEIVPGSALSPLTETGSGTITRDYWTGITGTLIGNLTNQASYPNSPTGTGTLTSLEGVNWADATQTANFADNYGQRIYGYLVAPTTGSYTFWVSGDDDCELWLSTTGAVANRTRIANFNGWTGYREWSKYTTQKSATVTLQAGARYYVEILMKEGSGGDSLSVGWAKPGQATTAPSEVVPGSALRPWGQ